MEEELPEDVKSILAPGERVLYSAKQKGSKFKPDLKKRVYPDMIIVTDRRILHFHPRGLIRGALGMHDYTDYPYADMKNIELKKGSFRASLKITPLSKLAGGKMPEIKDIGKNEAKDIFAIAREKIMLVQKREERPVVVTQAPVTGPQESQSPIEKLKKLGELKEAGIISEEEFQEKKKQLLSQI